MYSQTKQKQNCLIPRQQGLFMNILINRFCCWLCVWLLSILSCAMYLWSIILVGVGSSRQWREDRQGMSPWYNNHNNYVSTANHYNLLCRYLLLLTAPDFDFLFTTCVCIFKESSNMVICRCTQKQKWTKYNRRGPEILGGTWSAAASCRCRARGGAATRRWAKWCRISWTTPYPSAVVLRPQLWTPMYNVILSQGLILYVDGRWVGNQLSAASELRCEVRVSVARPGPGTVGGGTIAITI